MIKNIFRSYRQKKFKHILLQKSNYFNINNLTTLIIAPHPDDETFGCAGLIFEKKSLGSKVYVVFLTNGEGSLQNISKDEIRENRVNTSQDICENLNIDEVFYFDIEDGKIDSKNNDVIIRLKNLILEKDIKEVFVTHKDEGWKDHKEASLLVSNSIKKSDNISLYYYWVWVWYSVGFKKFKEFDLNSTMYLDIKEYSSQKQDMINKYLTNKTKDGIPYCGVLPKQFLKAFKNNIEVFEKVI